MTDWADHLPILPVLLPSLTAIVLLLIGDHGGDAQAGHGHRRLLWARRISLGSAALGLLLAALLVLDADGGGLRVYRVGDWPAPYGIVLVLDRLGALMLLLTALVALPVLWYACGGWDAHGRYFHAHLPVPADGPGRRLRHRRPVQPVRVLRGAADRQLRAGGARPGGRAAARSACTTWC